MELNKDQQISLLRLARKTIADKLNIDVDFKDDSFSDEIFQEKRGAFVTIHMRESLRGCIGYIKGVKPMKETIEDMALSAAFKDPRFISLTKDEYEVIDIEISILTPIVVLENIEDVKVGRDGLIITRGFQSGLLLPQVPVEQGWDRDTFIEHTCYKAGLPANAWKDPETKIETFSAQVFSEIELNLI